MSLIPYNQLFRKQQAKLVPVSFKRGVITSVNVATNSVSLYFTENPQTIVKNVPLALNIAVSTVKSGMQAGVQIFSEIKTSSMVVTSVF